MVEGGDMLEDEMIRETRRGFIVLNNWYTRLQNYIEGEFSTVTRDALMFVEKGEIVGYSQRMRIADKFPRLLRNIIGMSKKCYDIQWWEVRTPTRAPFILVSETIFTKPSV
ncbi:MAG: hypothetical protein DRO12_05995 [Thermoprotei archaeon]|nr:MAG: hypothetical protein DRO12_05995 [Thermoprotei archaeon]